MPDIMCSADCENMAWNSCICLVQASSGRERIRLVWGGAGIFDLLGFTTE